MKRAGAVGLWVYAVSALAHGALAFGVSEVDPPPPAPPPVRITVVQPPPPEPAMTKPEPPEPPPAEDVADELPSEPIAPAEPPPPKPASKPAKPKPAASPSAPQAAAAPDFGVSMGGGTSGTAVPAGDPNGDPGGGGSSEPPRPTSKPKKRVLAAEPADDGGCSEAEVKPRALEMPEPAYTDAARAAGITGKVRIEVELDADGSIVRAKVVSPLDPGLDAAALAAVKAAKFAPATRCGKPVATTFKIGVKFAL